MHPQVPIDVDEKTGVWTTDALPMLYVPRHFLVNNHEAVEQALGREAYAAILYAAGHKSAYYWCDREARQHGIRGVDVFAHYLTRISQRGWGQFSIAGMDPERATADIALRHSAFVLQAHEGNGKRCHMFAGWFAGAMDCVARLGLRTARPLPGGRLRRRAWAARRLRVRSPAPVSGAVRSGACHGRGRHAGRPRQGKGPAATALSAAGYSTTVRLSLMKTRRSRYSRTARASATHSMSRPAASSCAGRSCGPRGPPSVR